MAAKNLEHTIKTSIKYGMSEKQIIDRCSRDFIDLDTEEITREVQEVIENYGDYKLIQKIVRSKLVQEISGRDCYILDTPSREAIKITRERLKEILHPKKDISDRIYTCSFKYDPYNLKQIYEDSKGNWVYNVYRPPTWQADAFYEGSQIEQQNAIPEIYRKFILHLVDNEVPSYEYVLDWLANAIQRRNFCILTTIGQSGIGKGTLGEIMKGLVGEENFGETGNRILAERFNSQIKNRRIVYIDEVSIKSTKEEERLKVLVNGAVEVEAKGKDAEQISNHASFYMSSNSMDAIKIYADNRRYSVVSLTDKKLIEVMKVEEIKKLTTAENIQNFAEYLYHREVDENKMLKVFTSSRAEDIISAGLANWHDWFLDVYAIDNAGKTIPVEQVSKVLEGDHCKIAPGKKAFKELEMIYPKKLKVFRPTHGGKQMWCIKFPSKEE